MKIYDISLTITPELIVWPGDPVIQLARVSKIEDGANANVSRLELGVHTGTHVDAPYHFLNDSKVTVEQLDLDILTGRVQVVQLPNELDVITAAVLEDAHISANSRRVLFKTRNSSYWSLKPLVFHADFVGLDRSAADWVAEHDIRLVGIDYLSISPYKKSRPTHEALLKAGIVILEGLDLSEVQAGHYNLYCLPLKLGGSDGAPARAILSE